jgi:hypothetical protein
MDSSTGRVHLVRVHGRLHGRLLASRASLVGAPMDTDTTLAQDDQEERIDEEIAREAATIE